jgi:pyruvate kinase
MLESMITASTPTRAEASDVANAVCDGTDAIMLSAESAVGHNPPLVVNTMAKIAEAAEVVADLDQFARTIGPARQIPPITAALTHAAWQAAIDAKASAIVCCSRSGSTVRAMATVRPDVKLIALSPSPTTLRQEVLTWGVIPMDFPMYSQTDVMVKEAIRLVEHAGHVQRGDIVAVLAGAPGVSGSTDVLRLVRVGDDPGAR